MRIENPYINVLSAIVVFILAFTFFADEGLIARIIIITAGIFLFGRAIYTFYSQNKSKESRAERFARFDEEDQKQNTAIKTDTGQS